MAARSSSSTTEAWGQGEAILEPGRVDRDYWRELWRYRELFQVLAWRDVAVRYKQTAIGVAWAVVRPALTVIVFTVVFGRIAKLPSGGVPYPLLVFAGMLPWTFFAAALSDASNSLVGAANLISKVYFPRLIVPAASIAAALADFAVGLAVMAAAMAWYRFAPDWRMLLLPAFVAMAIAASLGPALWISALNVRYRDFRHAVPFLAQLGLYVSPVGFSAAVVPERWRLLYALNPMVGVIDGFRWCLLGAPIDWRVVGIGLAVSAAAIWIGLRRFRSTEKTFADVL
jgi:lipopolysaccharide transport system permease protein